MICTKVSLQSQKYHNNKFDLSYSINPFDIFCLNEIFCDAYLSDKDCLIILDPSLGKLEKVIVVGSVEVCFLHSCECFQGLNARTTYAYIGSIYRQPTS